MKKDPTLELKPGDIITFYHSPFTFGTEEGKVTQQITEIKTIEEVFVIITDEHSFSEAITPNIQKVATLDDKMQSFIWEKTPTFMLISEHRVKLGKMGEDDAKLDMNKYLKAIKIFEDITTKNSIIKWLNDEREKEVKVKAKQAKLRERQQTKKRLKKEKEIEKAKSTKVRSAQSATTSNLVTPNRKTKHTTTHPSSPTVTEKPINDDNGTPSTATKRDHKWSDDENTAVYRCYCKALALGKLAVKGTYEIWREENENVRPKMTPVLLANHRRYVEMNKISLANKISMRREVELEMTTNGETVVNSIDNPEKKEIITELISTPMSAQESKDISIKEEKERAKYSTPTRKRRSQRNIETDGPNYADGEDDVEMDTSSADEVMESGSKRKSPSRLGSAQKQQRINFEQHVDNANTLDQNQDEVMHGQASSVVSQDTNTSQEKGSYASIVRIGVLKESIHKKVQFGANTKPAKDLPRQMSKRYNVTISLGDNMELDVAKKVLVQNMRQLLLKIKEEESSMTLLPYSSSSSARPISNISQLPKTYVNMLRYIPSLRIEKGSAMAYSQIHLATTTHYDDWKQNVVEWTKLHGHGCYLRLLQAEHTSTAGYLHYTHKGTNGPWLNEKIEQLCKVPISTRNRKISRSGDNNARALHIECARDHMTAVKRVLHATFKKGADGRSITGFPLIFVPDRMHLLNNKAQAGAAVVAMRQAKLVKTLEIKPCWGVTGLDIINKSHKISLRTMLSKIMWTSADDTPHQLFHSVDPTWNGEGVMFSWHPIFKEQAQTVMMGLLPYLKDKYGATVEQYFSEGTLGMQSHQVWDSAAGGIVGEDDTAMAGIIEDVPWWEVIENETKVVVVDVSKISTSDTSPISDDISVPTIATKGDVSLNDHKTVVQHELLKEPPDVPRVLEDNTIASTLTIDTRLENVEGRIGEIRTEMTDSMSEMRNSVAATHKLLQQLVLNGNKQMEKAAGDIVSGGPVI